MAWTQEKVEATLKSVIEKAQADPLFREKLKQNPREVVETEAGEAIPESLRIAILDQNDADIVITLPKIENNELSDADLEQVAVERVGFIGVRSVGFHPLQPVFFRGFGGGVAQAFAVVARHHPLQGAEEGLDKFLLLVV